MTAVTLDSRLNGVVGGRTAAALERAFGMQRVRDLLWHVPRRYAERGELSQLAGLPLGEHVTVMARVLDVHSRSMQRGGSMLEAWITDGTGTLQLTFFNQAWRANELVVGAVGIFAGKVREYRGSPQLQHPDYELFTDQLDHHGSELPVQQARQLDQAAAQAFASRPVPIYPAVARLPSWTLARAVGLALDALADSDALADPLPPDIRAHAGHQGKAILPLAAAIELIHRPNERGDWQRARESLRFREAFDLQLALLSRRRRRISELTATARPPVTGGILDAFDAALPFALTAEQQQVGHTISVELARPYPMHRLLQGEVGSGKTLVAVRAMLQLAEEHLEGGSGGVRSAAQSALIAPTEVLASQHFRSITETLGPQLTERLRPVLLTSNMSTSERRRALLALASGRARIAIGTHALLSEHVTFYDLGLIVVDEQHRFGVEQREQLRLKGANPHVLAMTATPIPRTVAMTVFGDLDISRIRQLPPGRQGIDTFMVPVHALPVRAARVWLRSLEDIAAGRQVYVVCPAIASEQRASVEQTAAELQQRPDYRGVRIATLTGAMKAAEKDRVMREFAAGQIDLLIATTVVEVGVDVPNASIMIVRDAEHFGVSQLHQLRGRVGRGEHPGLCLLLTCAEEGSLAWQRIEAVATISDGFALAERDLQLRHEGDVLGDAQSGGRSALQLLRAVKHGEIIERARRVADELLQRDPHLAGAPMLAQQVTLAEQQRSLDYLSKS